MRTSEHTGGSIRSAAIGLALLIGAGTTGVAQAQTAGAIEAPILQFHSFEPASPRVAAKILAGPSLWKGDLESARKAWRKGQYKKAKAAFERAWNNGNLVAAWYLGHIYRLGRGAKANPARAFFYYRQVALAYDPDDVNRKRLMMTVDALVRVANYYRTGIGKKRKKYDPKRAFRLYNIAAGHGHPAAFYGLGLIALHGEGMKKRPRRAINWLIKAARGGYAPAAVMLGKLAETGVKGQLRRNEVAALSWYMVAAARARGKEAERIRERIRKLKSRTDKQSIERARRMARAFIASTQQPPRAITAAQ